MRHTRALSAFAVIAVLLIAPLASLASGAEEPDYKADSWNTFDYGEAADLSYPTLFTDPLHVPVVTWTDSLDRLRLSRLEIYRPPKTGLVLSNLPEGAGLPGPEMQDRVAMDANGLLHVVWEDGEGGVWHKGYDGFGNVLTTNHLMSAVEADARSPAIAATLAREGEVAWMAWIETREHIGTHVRLASIGPAGSILRSAYVDDWTQDLSPLAVDVAVDLEGQPHVSILAEGGAYWAVPDGEGGFDLLAVHDGIDESLPHLAFSPNGGPWALWLDEDYLYRRALDGSALGATEIVLLHFSTWWYNPSRPRATDLATRLNGGPLLTLTGDKKVGLLLVDELGEFDYDWTLGWSPDAMGNPAIQTTATTDDRSQTVLACEPRGYIVHDRACDATLSSKQGASPEEPVPLLPGGSHEVPVTVTNIAGYDTEVTLAVTMVSKDAGFSASIVEGPVLELEASGRARVGVRFSAAGTAPLGSSAVYEVRAFHAALSSWGEDWPDSYSAILVHLEVPSDRPFLVRGPDEPVLAVPGEAVFTKLTVESWSTSEETVGIHVTAPRGWEVTVDREATVPPMGSVDVPVELAAPEGTPEGTEVELDVTLTDADGAVVGGTSVDARVIRYEGARLELASSTLEVMPGGSASVEVRVRNAGNVELEILMSAAPSHEGWSTRCVPSSLRLMPGSEAPLVVWVEAPEDALDAVQCRVTVRASTTSGLTLDSVSLVASAGRVTGYDIGLIPISAPMMAGGTELTARVSNLGNVPETLALSFLGLPQGWRATVTSHSGPLTLDPGEVRDVRFLVTCPQDTPAGEVDVAVQARGSRGPVVAWAKLHVAPVFTVDMDVPENAFSLTPPGTVRCSISLSATGNIAGLARLLLVGLPYGWDYAFSTPEGGAVVSFPIDVGASRDVALSLKVPADADGDHAIDVLLRSGDGVELGRATIYVRLRLPDLAVVGMTYNPVRPRAGEPLTVRARVVNLGMADAQDVKVVLRDGPTVLDMDQLSVVPRMGELEVVLYAVPETGRRTLTLEVDPGDEVRELSEANNLLKRRIDVEAAEEEPLVPAPVVTASVTAAVTLSILGLLWGHEAARYGLLTLLLLPLYTKIRKDRVLDHYLRGKIHGYIIANPGEHYNAIKDQLNVTNGALSYHLRVLEREGYVRSRMDGMYKRFYPADMKLPRSERNISSFQEVILTIVKNNQGLSQKDIAKRIGASSQVINYHIKILEDSGLIKVDRRRRKSRVYATDAPTARSVVE